MGGYSAEMSYRVRIQLGIARIRAWRRLFSVRAGVQGSPIKFGTNLQEFLSETNFCRP